MQTKTVYFSPTGATRKIATTIATALGTDNPYFYDITRPANRDKIIGFQADDITVFAVPVYGGRVPQVAASYIKQLEGAGSKALAVAVYGNRDFDDALLELRDLLSERNFQVISCAGFIGEHTYNSKVGENRPDAADLALAGEFAGKTLSKLAGGDLSMPNVRGNNPYKAPMPPMGLAPITDSGCTSCMICVDGCPTGAIPESDPTWASSEKCIVCTACVKSCPEGIKYFNSEHLDKAAGWLQSNFTARKEPEIYL